MTDPQPEQQATSHAPGRPSYDDINTPVIFLIGVIAAIVTFLTIAFVEGLCYHWEARLIKTINYDVVNWRQADIIEKQKAKVRHGPKDGYLTFDEAVSNVLDRFQNQAEDQPSDPATEGESE